jgi:hypothetical protein
MIWEAESQALRDLVLSLGMSPWISELKFTTNPLFFIGLGLIAAPILAFSWQSQQSSAGPSDLREIKFEPSVSVPDSG